VGGRAVELVRPDVDAPRDALRVLPGAALTVDGGTLRAARAAVASDGEVLLRGVGTSGSVAGAVRADPAAAARPAGDPAVPGGWWDRPGRGVAAVAVLALVASGLLEVLRGRQRRPALPPGGPAEACGDGGSDGGGGEELVLDLGERWVR
jgi:hypothetical protein